MSEASRDAQRRAYCSAALDLALDLNQGFGCQAVAILEPARARTGIHMKNTVGGGPLSNAHAKCIICIAMNK